MKLFANLADLLEALQELILDSFPSLAHSIHINPWFIRTVSITSFMLTASP
jgi:hypothetical protein